MCALLEEELGDELKSPGDRRRAEVTHTAIASESAQCVRALVPEYNFSHSGGHTLRPTVLTEMGLDNRSPAVYLQAHSSSVWAERSSPL